MWLHKNVLLSSEIFSRKRKFSGQNQIEAIFKALSKALSFSRSSSGHGCSTGVERMPRNKEVMDSNPVGC